MGFKRWSEHSAGVLEQLKPSVAGRSWNDFALHEKQAIWSHFRNHFYRTDNGTRIPTNLFSGLPSEQKRKRDLIHYTIDAFSKAYRVREFARAFSKQPNEKMALEDFQEIFLVQEDYVVLELLSFYCQQLLIFPSEGFMPKKEGEGRLDYNDRREYYCQESFTRFRIDLNDIFEQYGVNVVMTSTCFIPRQEKVIIDDIYLPVLASLVPEPWSPVNSLLKDAFDEYNKHTPQSYSVCVTHSVAAVQAYLQILVNGQTGKGEIGKLIVQAQVKELLPNDSFTNFLFKNVESVLMQQRQEAGVAHPKSNYASQKNARSLLNVVMVFLQHSLQS